MHSQTARDTLHQLATIAIIALLCAIGLGQTISAAPPLFEVADVLIVDSISTPDGTEAIALYCANQSSAVIYRTDRPYPVGEARTVIALFGTALGSMPRSSC